MKILTKLGIEGNSLNLIKGAYGKKKPVADIIYTGKTLSLAS